MAIDFGVSLAFSPRLYPSISDYRDDLGRRLVAAYHEIVAGPAIHDSIEPVASPTDVAQVLIDTPTNVDFDAIATSLDTVARSTAELHSDIFSIIDNWE